MPRIADEWKRVFGQLPTEADIHEMYEEFEEILFSILPSYATPIDGVKEVIASLRERGIKIGSTTGYTREMMEIVAKEAALQGYKPDFLVTPDDVPVVHIHGCAIKCNGTWCVSDEPYDKGRGHSIRYERR